MRPDDRVHKFSKMDFSRKSQSQPCPASRWLRLGWKKKIKNCIQGLWYFSFYHRVFFHSHMYKLMSAGSAASLEIPGSLTPNWKPVETAEQLLLVGSVHSEQHNQIIICWQYGKNGGDFNNIDKQNLCTFNLIRNSSVDNIKRKKKHVAKVKQLPNRITSKWDRLIECLSDETSRRWKMVKLVMRKKMYGS